MSKWVHCSSCLLLFIAGTVLNSSAQNLRTPPQVIKTTEAFGDSEYRLGPEDVIEVFVWKEDDLSGTAVVRPDGKITMKLIGEIVASKKTARELETEILSALKKFNTDPSLKVNVVVKEVNSPKVSVFGEVKKPDVYRIKQKTTVLDAIALGGGFTEFAKRDKVVVIREGKSGQEKFKLNLESMLQGKKDEAVFFLQPGDTVYVPE
jgi:polysaccharide export outer membrane protein